MKTLIVTLFSCLLLASKMTGQTQKQIRDARLKPLTDTAYVYIEGIHKVKGDGRLVEIWQTDLQTGDRWYSLCPRKENVLRDGDIVRMLRSKMDFIEPKNK